MKLKNISVVITGILAIAIIAFYFVSANSQTNSAKINIAGDTAKIYTCPMHPDVISDKPGQCPKCGMDLILKNNGSDSTKMDMNMKDMKKDMNMNMGNCNDNCKDMGCKMENCGDGSCKGNCPMMKDMKKCKSDCKSGCMSK